MIVVNGCIKPRFIFKNGGVHSIIWADSRFTVYQYSIETNRIGELIKINLIESFHPNAKNENFEGVVSIYEPPDIVQLCIPDIFKGKIFGTDITKDMIKNLISNWNLDDCYYMPHPHLYICEPKL